MAKENKEDLNALWDSYTPAVATPAATPSSSQESPSTFRDFLTAAGQGMTFGFSDELLAGIKAAASANDFSQLKDLYEKYHAVEQEKVKGAEERSPMVSIAGNVAGGIIPGVLTAGLGGAATIGRAATAAGKIGQAAKLGAVGGGVYGLGASEAKLTEGELGKAARDVAVGAGIGAGLGVGIEGIGQKVLPWIKTKIQDIPLLRQTGIAYEEGLKGKGFVGTEAERRMQSEEAELAEKISKKYLQERENLGKLLGAEAQQAANRGIILEPTNELITISSDLESVLPYALSAVKRPQNKAAFRHYFNLLQKGELDPEQAHELSKLVKEITKDRTLQSGLFGDKNVHNVASQFQDELLSSIENTITGNAPRTVSLPSNVAEKLNLPRRPAIPGEPMVESPTLPKRTGDVTKQNLDVMQTPEKGFLYQQEVPEQKLGGAGVKALGDVEQIPKVPTYTKESIERAGEQTPNEYLVSSIIPKSKYMLAREKFKNFSQATADQIMTGELSPELSAKPHFSSYPYKVASEKLTNDILQTIREIGIPGVSREKGKGIINKLEVSLAGFERQYPGELQRMGLDDVISQIERQGDISAIRAHILGIQAREGGQIYKHILGVVNPQAAFDVAANISGRVAKFNKGVAQSIGTSIKDLTPESIKGVIESVSKVPELQHFAKALRDAEARGDSVKKYAAIFALGQNPMGRSIMGTFIPGTDTNESK